MEPRYPFAPLAAAMGMAEHAAAVQLGLSGSTMQDYRGNGVTERMADRLAIKAGLHPYGVWPQLLEDVARGPRRRSQARWFRDRYRSDPAFAAADRDRSRERRLALGESARAAERRRLAEYHTVNRTAILARKRARRRVEPAEERPPP